MLGRNQMVKQTKRKQLPPGPGRPKGSQNKTTTALREAILLAAEQVGEDAKGKDGLTGYLRRLAQNDARSFAVLLGKVLPLQVTGEGGGPIQVTRIELVAADGNRSD